MTTSVNFSQPWGGLGDNLQFSNLPKLYNSIGTKFFISIFNYTRNKEIEDLVWIKNDFVSRNKRIFPNVGYKVLIDSNFRLVNQEYNNIQNINVLHGFEPGLGFPEFNLSEYNLKNQSKEFDLILDVNAFSLFQGGVHLYDEEEFNNMINSYTSASSIELIFPNLYKKNIVNKTSNKLEIYRLKDLIEVLLNTKTFVCLNSGSHVLAAGLKEMTGSPKNIISFNNFYDNIKIKSGKVLNKNGKFYFDNVFYHFIKKNSKLKDLENNLNFTDLQDIEPKMDKYIKLNQLYFHYLKKFFK
jgi:hypothetical protein